MSILTAQMIRDYAKLNQLTVTRFGTSPPNLSAGNILQHILCDGWNPRLDWWQLIDKAHEMFDIDFEDWSQLEIGSDDPSSPHADFTNKYYIIGLELNEYEQAKRHA